MKKLIFLLTASLMLVGCVANGPKVNISTLVPVAGDSARIFLLRESAFYGIADIPDISLNGVETPDLLNGGAIQIDVNPGRHALRLSGWGRPGASNLSFTLSPGNTAFIQVAPNTGYAASAALGGLIGASMAASGENGGPYVFKLLDRPSGMQLLSGLTLVKSNSTMNPVSIPVSKEPDSKELTAKENISDAGNSKANKLRELKSLLDEKVITQDEFNKLKKDILKNY